jgi:small redox-active disulfide protein 2
MKIEIYGTGCQQCRDLYEHAATAVAECGVTAEIIKIEDINQITNAGVFFTPAIAIDGEVKSTGKVLGVDDIKNLIA